MFHLEAKYAGTKQLLDKKKTKQIIFRHSHIAITDYTLGDNWEFEKLLSVWDKMTFKYILMGGYYVKSLREFRVNRGFNVYILRQHFPGYPMVVENCAYDSKPAKIELYTAPRSDFQKVALSFMLAKGEFTNNEKFTQCIITSNPGSGKCLRNSTMIPTPYRGKVRADEIEVGDCVYNRMGEPIKVLAVYPNKEKRESYRVFFEDGRYIDCTDDHLWTVYDSGYKSGRKWHNVTTSHMIDTFEKHTYKVPMCSPIGCEDYPVETREEELFEYFDTASTMLHPGGRVEVYNIPYDKACELQELAWTLGFSATLEVTPLNETHVILQPKTKLQIVDIKKLPGKYYHRCFLVDDPEHLFLCGDYIVTHNTYCGTAVTALRKARALVIVPLAKLLPQWAESYTNFTSVKEDEILMVQGGKVCEEILEGKHKDKKVFIAMIDTIAAFNKRYGDIRTMDLLSATRAEIKIVDEIHLDLKAISMLEAMSNFKYNYYMSATPGRSDGKENWMFKQLFYHVPKFGEGFVTQEEKHLNIMVKRYYFTPTPRQINRMVNRKVGINTKLYERELALSPPEVRQSFKDSLILMLNWANKQVKKGNKIMVLGQSIDFLKYIYSIIQEVIPEEDCGLYYGGMKKEEKEESLQKKVIVATTSTLGTGADIKGLQFVINAATYSSWVMVTQVSGRLRKLPDDTPTVYIELVNFGYIKTINQFESRKPHLLKVSKTNKIIIVD